MNPTQAWSDLCDKLDRQNELLAGIHAFLQADQQHSKQLREWEEFTLWDGGAVGAAATTITIGSEGSNLIPAPNGWEAYISRVVLAASGASSGARAAVFRGANTPQNLIDRAVAFGLTSINAVSYYTNVSDYSSPTYFVNAEPITVEFAGLANSAQITVRVSGKRRQV